MTQSMTVGVDGCRAGWVAATSDSVCLFTDVEALVAGYPATTRFLIDMPMGLPDIGPRDLELQARAQMPAKKASSLFAIPCRAAVYAADYPAACETNLQAQGKKFSIQTWNICNKMRELDSYLVAHRDASQYFYESHPELAFARLADLQVLPSKKTKEGFDVRLQILRQFLPNVDIAVQQVLEATKRADVAKDDVLDALVLCVTSLVPNEQMTDSAGCDERGIPIRMLLPLAMAIPD